MITFGPELLVDWDEVWPKIQSLRAALVASEAARTRAQDELKDAIDRNAKLIATNLHLAIDRNRAEAACDTAEQDADRLAGMTPFSNAAAIVIRCRVCQASDEVMPPDENRWYETHICEQGQHPRVPADAG